MKWRYVINGRRALNGQRYSVTFFGDIELADDGITIYDAMRELAVHVQTNNTEMEHPDSFQLTVS